MNSKNISVKLVFLFFSIRVYLCEVPTKLTLIFSLTLEFYFKRRAEKSLKKMKLFFLFYFLLCHAASFEIVGKDVITLYPGNNKIVELTDATLAQSVFNSPQGSNPRAF